MRILISYSHDSDGHRDAVRDLANCMRRRGYDAWIDQFATDPDEGWLRWMRDQIDAADFVLIVPTATYLRRWRGHEQPGKGKGKGATFEGMVLTNRLYRAHGRAKGIRAILVGEATEQHIPDELRTHTHFQPPRDCDRLERYLRGLPTAAPDPLGHLPPLAELPQAWTTPTPPRWDPRLDLENFLKNRFSNSEIERLISYLPRGSKLRMALPKNWLAPNAYVSAVVEVLRDQGELGVPDFWERLRAERGRFAAEIDLLESAWR
ncbi:MAG: TIR domain-containing protein [Oligoflexia bacterium]|nr:TIR domain-containing protein [Oligoflexia bacterium]